MAALAPAYLHRADADVLRDAMADTTFSADAMRRGFEVLAEWSAVDRLGAIVAPTLVIAGRHDPFTSWSQAHRIAARVPGADVVIFEDSSHFPWLDEPGLFFATIRVWLQRHGMI
jgi:proline iminopeptidase